MTTLKSATAPLWQLIFGIVDKPATTYKAVAARRTRRTWAVPLILVVLCLMAMVVVQSPYTVEKAQQQAERQLQSLPSDQQKAVRASMETFTSLPFILATGLAAGSLALLAGILAQAAFLYFATLVTGGEVAFGTVFTLSVWSRLPAAIGFLTLAAFTTVARRLVEYPGLAALAATGDMVQDAQNPLVALLGRIDLFWLWHLLLVGIGLAVLGRRGRSKALLLTLLYAILTLAAAALPTMLFGGAAR